jgi:hypothetical protein
MLGLHKTKDHRQMPIVTMGTGHIINYLNLSLRQITAMVTQCHKKSSGLVARLARIQETKVTQEDIDRACIDFLEEKAPYIAELMRRALFLDDEKAKLFVHKIFSQIGEDLLTDLVGTEIGLPQASISKSKYLVPVPRAVEEDEEDFDLAEFDNDYYGDLD